MKTPREIVQHMMANDAYSQWLGIKVLDIVEGACILRAQVTESMVNGFGIAHGGISYALADSALAFASNSRGYQCVSIETSISHVKKVVPGDQLTAEANELHRGRKVGLYEVIVRNQRLEPVAFFKGTVNIAETIWSF